MEAVRKSSSGKPSLRRTKANKSISYDVNGSMRRRLEELDSDSFSDWSVDEFSVHGKQDVEEMNMMLRFLGLPGPANLGITSEAWESVKQSPSVSPVDMTGQSPHPDSFVPEPDRYALLPTPSYGRTGFASPTEPLVWQSTRTPQLVAESSPPVHPIQPPGDVQVGVENRFQTSAVVAAIFPSGDDDGGDKKERFTNVVRQAVEKNRSKIIADAVAVSNFIHIHGEGDLPRHESLPVRFEDGQDPPLPSVRSRPERVSAAGQQLGRSQSEPIPELIPGCSYINERNKIEQNEDELKSRGIHHNSADQGGEDRNTAAAGESGRKGGDLLSRPRSPLGNTQVAAAKRSSKSLPTLRQETEKPLLSPNRGHDGSKSPSIVLKPPPRMSIVRPPLEQFSTMDMLGSLAPDLDNPTSTWSSESDDDKLSDDGDEEESADATERDLLVSGDKPEHLNRVSDGGGTTVDEEKQQETRPMLKLHVPERNLMRMASVVGQNPESNLPKVSGKEHPVGPKFPWTKGDMLGAGSFGTVYDAVDSEGMWFAVKEVSMVEQDKQAQQCIAQLMQEVELLSQFKHENIVQYLGTEKAHGKLYIFLELVSKGSLAAVCKRIKLSHSQISAYTRQILKGLKYLHDQSVVHRDIKCANILVDITGICKLADFGMAKQIGSLDQMKSCKGSAYWMAPEVIDPKKTYGHPADIWSLGCSILEMATGSPPFGDMEWYRVLWTVGHGNAPPIPETLSEAAKDFIKLCLDINPLKRPTAAELLDHPFVRLPGCMTPTKQDLESFTTSIKTLQTITEEQSADFSNGSSTQESSTLSNGHTSAKSS